VVSTSWGLDTGLHKVKPNGFVFCKIYQLVWLVTIYHPECTKTYHFEIQSFLWGGVPCPNTPVVGASIIHLCHSTWGSVSHTYWGRVRCQWLTVMKWWYPCWYYISVWFLCAVMAFVTYVLLAGVVLGTQSR